MLLRGLSVFLPAEEFLTQHPIARACRKSTRRRFLHVVPVLVVLVAAIAVQAQNYTKIVVFGDSLSDTGNDLITFETSVPPIPFPSPFTGIPVINYTVGHFTDGTDTTPAAQKYHGVWIEQLAAALPAQPLVAPSLLGGTNHAFGFGNTFNGTTLFVLFGPFQANVENVGMQIDDYLATNPKIDDHTLFVVWAGANNLTEAALAGSPPSVIVDGAIAQVGNVQRLINAGATQFLVPNLPNLGSVPRFNTSPTESAAFNQASVLYNATLDAGVSLLPLVNFRRHVTIYRFDVYSLLKNIIAHPANYGLQNVTGISQENPLVANPDTYLFWDDLHPTTRGHNILGQAALKLIEPPGCVAQSASGQLVGVAAPGCR